MESTKAEVIEYFNKRLPHYKDHLKRTDKYSRLIMMKENLSKMVGPGAIVLDVGCGVGVLSEYLASLGAIVTAIDIAPDLIAYAKEYSSYENITYIVGDVVDLDIDQRFDIILLSDVLEHLPRKDNFAFLWRIIRQNAHSNSMIVLEVPDANFIRFMEDNYPEKLQIIDEGYTIDYIVSLFEYWGFVPIRMNIHGIDTDAQYNYYVFITKKRMNNHYRLKLKETYGGK